MNQCNFTGRLTRKPELHHVQSGQSITSINLAVKRNRPDSNGNWITDFIDCVAWRGLAEKICSKCDKGDLVAVTGRLQNRTINEKDGTQVVVAEIVIDVFEKISSPKPSDKSSAQDHPVLSPSDASDPGSDFTLLEGEDLQLPF